MSPTGGWNSAVRSLGCESAEASSLPAPLKEPNAVEIWFDSAFMAAMLSAAKSRYWSRKRRIATASCNTIQGRGRFMRRVSDRGEAAAPRTRVHFVVNEALPLRCVGRSDVTAHGHRVVRCQTTATSTRTQQRQRTHLRSLRRLPRPPKRYLRLRLPRSP
jgi:hypothetical protein